MPDCIYLATTAAELWKNFPYDQKIAYMACHFSLYGPGLSNIPARLPAGSILILNDRIPIHGHDPGLIVAQLARTAEALSCSGVLLDLQRPGDAHVQALCRECMRLPCPVAITPDYAADLDCAVFAPPVPPDRSVASHLQAYKGRKLWLELASDALALTLTEEGCHAEEYPPVSLSPCFTDPELHCSYQHSICSSAAHFTLWRTGQQLKDLAREAQALGVEAMVGLYQQLRDVF